MAASPSLDKAALKVSDNAAHNNSLIIKTCTQLNTHPVRMSRLNTTDMITWSRRAWAFSAGSSRSPAVALRTAGVLFHSRRGTVCLATFSNIFTVCPALKNRDNDKRSVEHTGNTKWKHPDQILRWSKSQCEQEVPQAFVKGCLRA